MTDRSHLAAALLGVAAVVLFAFAIAVNFGYANSAIAGSLTAQDFAVLGVLALIGAVPAYALEDRA